MRHGELRQETVADDLYGSHPRWEQDKAKTVLAILKHGASASTLRNDASKQGLPKPYDLHLSCEPTSPSWDSSGRGTPVASRTLLGALACAGYPVVYSQSQASPTNLTSRLLTESCREALPRHSKFYTFLKKQDADQPKLLVFWNDEVQSEKRALMNRGQTVCILVVLRPLSPEKDKPHPLRS